MMIISGVAMAVLVGAGAAFAASGAFNSYTATQTFSSSVGSPKHPSPMGFHEVWTAKGLNGHNAAPITKVVSKIYGMRTNGGKFPTCTAKQINHAGSTKGTWNKVCPKGSLIASGPVNSLFEPYNNATASGAPACNPYLTIYNGGQGTQTFFFSEYPFAPGTQYTCLNGAVHTGAAAAYTGYVTQPSAANHNTWSIKIPLPASVSTMAGGINGVYASLIKLDVNYKKLTKKVNGKTVGYAESIGSKNGTRPYSFTFSAQNYAGQSPQTQTTTVNGTA
jgi:hypothetical protein